MQQDLSRPGLGLGLFYKVDFMLGIIESCNISFRSGFLSLLQNPEIGVLKSLARMIDFGVAHSDSSCGHFEISVP